MRDLLVDSAAAWTIQDLQPTIASMWEGLSSGRLSVQSRILVFSDVLVEGPGAASELEQTAGAVAAMCGAGASVFIAIWNRPQLARLEALIAKARTDQGLRADQVTYHLLPMEQGGAVVLDYLRRGLEGVVTFPAKFPAVTSRPLSRQATTRPRRGHATVVLPSSTSAPLPSSAPGQAPTGQAPTGQASSVSAASVPAPTRRVPAAPDTPVADASAELASGACADLLAQPVLPGQTTIAFASNKGGSGKSTVALLLCAAIARASREAGKPLSVCLVDMDVRGGQVSSLLGKHSPTAMNIRVQSVWDEVTILRNLVYDETLAIHALLAPMRPRTGDTDGPEFYRTMIRSLQRMFDVIIIDTGVEYLDPLIAEVCLPEATAILYVTTLAATAVDGMGRALHDITTEVDEGGLGIPAEKIGIVVNQSVAGVGIDRDHLLATSLGIPLIGAIPLATKDVLTAGNLHRMGTLLDHPLLGPAYNDLAHACLPGRTLAEGWGLAEFPAVIPDAPVDHRAIPASVPLDLADPPSGRKGRAGQP